MLAQGKCVPGKPYNQNVDNLFDMFLLTWFNKIQNRKKNRGININHMHSCPSYRMVLNGATK